jgi:hypothetical protein
MSPTKQPSFNHSHQTITKLYLFLNPPNDPNNLQLIQQLKTDYNFEIINQQTTKTHPLILTIKISIPNLYNLLEIEPLPIYKFTIKSSH